MELCAFCFQSEVRDASMMISEEGRTERELLQEEMRVKLGKGASEHNHTMYMHCCSLILFCTRHLLCLSPLLLSVSRDDRDGGGSSGGSGGAWRGSSKPTSSPPSRGKMPPSGQQQQQQQPSQGEEGWEVVGRKR